MSPHHCITTSLHHHVSQSFALPPATKPVSHLPCLPQCHCITVSLHHHITTSPHHRITVLVSHLPCPLPPNQSVICLAPYHCMSLHPHTTASPCHRITVSLCHHISQSFALHHVTKPVSHLPCPAATKPVSYLPCPLPQCITASPCHCTTTSPCHHITALVSHLPCPLPPNQSVICLAPCHQTSQSFALPPATKPVSHLPCPLPLCHCIPTPLCHHVTASLHHHITASPC